MAATSPRGRGGSGSGGGYSSSGAGRHRALLRAPGPSAMFRQTSPRLRAGRLPAAPPAVTCWAGGPAAERAPPGAAPAPPAGRALRPPGPPPSPEPLAPPLPPAPGRLTGCGSASRRPEPLPRADGGLLLSPPSPPGGSPGGWTPRGGRRAALQALGTAGRGVRAALPARGGRGRGRSWEGFFSPPAPAAPALRGRSVNRGDWNGRTVFHTERLSGQHRT
ncbi:formin-like protein 20 [Sciurus carolinensis]|uniref:formin-like protein 20 n=1 Tax=Sciurus carolinensis TaxID=30640 RepID=UPI001FB1E888|nr:formin-like protein 20 [Sciurus carolinensis]XP_047404392.1 formin-like protein 20 [Sciurus carolinensis]